MIWTGDAGLGASLDDMIAWERHIDATRDDAAALYQPPVGAGRRSPMAAPAHYGFGLARDEALGRAATGHGGALRGWRSHRLYLPAERVSVVVMFNHLSDARCRRDRRARRRAGRGTAGAGAAAARAGLARRLCRAGDRAGGAHRGGGAGAGAAALRSWRPETLDLQADGSAGSGARAAGWCRRRSGLWLDRPAENLFSTLVPAKARDRAPMSPGATAARSWTPS